MIPVWLMTNRMKEKRGLPHWHGCVRVGDCRITLNPAESEVRIPKAFLAAASERCIDPACSSTGVHSHDGVMHDGVMIAKPDSEPS